MPPQHLSISYKFHPFPPHLLTNLPHLIIFALSHPNFLLNLATMMLRAPLFSSTAATPAPGTPNRVSGFPPGGVAGVGVGRGRENGYPGVVAAVKEGGPITGIVFQPFEEVKSDNFIVPISPNESLARQRFVDECEAAINEQINVEYSASYVYHSLFAYFDRDNVALKGFAKFFKESSEEEREHAEKLMTYQNMRGGRVKLYSILMPPSEFEHAEKGDALYAMELALSLEKLVNEKLLNLHSVAGKNNDPQLQDFVEGEFLNEQVEAIKKISNYVTQLRMVGKGHGVWHFDQMLLDEGGAP